MCAVSKPASSISPSTASHAGGPPLAASLTEDSIADACKQTIGDPEPPR
jgi:hypothetical protein